MGYHSIKGLFYCVEMLLHPLDDDKGALNMLHIARHYGEVHMFVVHGVDEAQVEDNIVEPEEDVGRPLESGESSHVVNEFEVVGIEIVVRSAPREDVMNQETEIGSQEGEVVDSLRRSALEIVAGDMGEGIGHLEEEVGVEDVGTGIGNPEAETGLDDMAEGDDERDYDDERVEVESWIDSDADSLRDSDGQD